MRAVLPGTQKAARFFRPYGTEKSTTQRSILPGLPLTAHARQGYEVRILSQGSGETEGVDLQPRPELCGRALQSATAGYFNLNFQITGRG